MHRLTTDDVYDLLFGSTAAQRAVAQRHPSAPPRLDVARLLWSEEGRTTWQIPDTPAHLVHLAVHTLIGGKDEGREGWWAFLSELLESPDVSSSTVITPHLLKAMTRDLATHQHHIAPAISLLFSRFHASFRPTLEAFIDLLNAAVRLDVPAAPAMDMDCAAFWLRGGEVDIEDHSTDATHAALTAWMAVQARSTNQRKVFAVTATKLLGPLVALWTARSCVEGSTGWLAAEAICAALFHSEHVAGFADALDDEKRGDDEPARKRQRKASYHRALVEALGGMGVPAVFPLLMHGFLAAAERAGEAEKRDVERGKIAWFRVLLRHASGSTWATVAVLERIRHFNAYRMAANHDSEWYSELAALFERAGKATAVLRAVFRLDYRIVEPRLGVVWADMWAAEPCDEGRALHIDIVTQFAKIRRFQAMVDSQCGVLMAAADTHAGAYIFDAAYTAAYRRAVRSLPPGEVPMVFDSVVESAGHALAHGGDWGVICVVLAHTAEGLLPPSAAPAALARLATLRGAVQRVVAHAPASWYATALILALRHAASHCMPFTPIDSGRHRAPAMLALGGAGPDTTVRDLLPSAGGARANVAWLALALDRATELVRAVSGAPDRRWKGARRELAWLVDAVLQRGMGGVSGVCVPLEQVTDATMPGTAYSLLATHLPVILSATAPPHALAGILVDAWVAGDAEWMRCAWFHELAGFRAPFLAAVLTRCACEARRIGRGDEHAVLVFDACAKMDMDTAVVHLTVCGPGDNAGHSYTGGALDRLVTLLAFLPTEFFDGVTHTACVCMGVAALSLDCAGDAADLVVRSLSAVPVAGAVAALMRVAPTPTALRDAAVAMARHALAGTAGTDDVAELARTLADACAAAPLWSSPDAAAGLAGLAGVLATCHSTLLAEQPPTPSASPGPAPAVWAPITRAASVMDRMLAASGLPVADPAALFRVVRGSAGASTQFLAAAAEYLHTRALLDAWSPGEWAVSRPSLAGMWVLAAGTLADAGRDESVRRRAADVVGAFVHRHRELAGASDTERHGELLECTMAALAASSVPCEAALLQGFAGAVHGVPHGDMGALLRSMRYEMGVTSVDQATNAARCLDATLSVLRGRRARVLAVVTRPLVLSVVGLFMRAQGNEATAVVLLRVLTWIVSHDSACPFVSDELPMVLHCVTGVLQATDTVPLSVCSAACRAVWTALRHRGRAAGRAPHAVVAALRALLALAMPCPMPRSASDRMGSAVAGLLPHAAGSDAPDAVGLAGDLARVYEQLAAPDMRGAARKFAAVVVADYCVAVKSLDPSPELRRALRPGIFAVMDTMSEFEFLQLSRAADHASRAIFKHLHTVYEKTHRYSGHV